MGITPAIQSYAWVARLIRASGGPREEGLRSVLPDAFDRVHDWAAFHAFLTKVKIDVQLALRKQLYVQKVIPDLHTHPLPKRGARVMASADGGSGGGDMNSSRLSGGSEAGETAPAHKARRERTAWAPKEDELLLKGVETMLRTGRWDGGMEPVQVRGHGHGSYRTDAAHARQHPRTPSQDIRIQAFLD